MVKNTPTVSVIVSTYNRPDTLKVVLLALANQDTDDFEVIVADDGSDPATRNQVEELRSKLPFHLAYVWQVDDGFRLSMIRNKAVIVARGDYLIFIDGDSVPLPSFVRYQKKMAEKGYFVSGSRVLLSQIFTEKILRDDTEIYRWNTVDWLRAYFHKIYNRFTPFILLPQLPHKWRKLRTKKWRGVRGCNIAVWKSDYFMVNGFDENYSGWGLEDSDFIVRLLHAEVLRKDGNFAVPVIHLWHPDNSRNQLSINQQKFQKVVASARIKAECGVDQYITG